MIFPFLHCHPFTHITLLLHYHHQFTHSPINHPHSPNLLKYLFTTTPPVTIYIPFSLTHPHDPSHSLKRFIHPFTHLPTHPFPIPSPVNHQVLPRNKPPFPPPSSATRASSNSKFSPASKSHPHQQDAPPAHASPTHRIA